MNDVMGGIPSSRDLMWFPTNQQTVGNPCRLHSYIDHCGALLPLDKIFTHTRATYEEQPYIKKWRNQLQNGRGSSTPGSTIKWLPLLTLRGESWWMEEIAKKNQDGHDRMLSISILTLNKLHVLLHIST